MRAATATATYTVNRTAHRRPATTFRAPLRACHRISYAGPLMRSTLRLAFVLGCSSSCSNASEHPARRECAPAPPAPACAPAYEPTFTNVFERTLKPSCGRGGAACHTATGRQGGLVFENVDEAYEGLQAGPVAAGDPDCSGIVVRVTAADPNVRMPPGRALAAEEQCAIARWIADGAKR